MTMPGETDLARLLGMLAPEQVEGEWVFCARPEGEPWPAGLVPRMVLREREATTLIVPRAEAEAAGWAFEGVHAQLTLTVQSSLAAVGLTAAVATALAAAGLPANVVAGCHHDHVFVPLDRAEAALAALRRLQAAHVG